MSGKSLGYSLDRVDDIVIRELEERKVIDGMAKACRESKVSFRDCRFL